VIGILTGLVWQGAVVLVLYLFVSNLDAVIRPRIIPKSITLSAGLTMLAAFGGIALFGLLGVVYGPIIMIVLVTSVEMYLAETSTKKVSA
jgi:predicted PurR-regulated permease PerM